MTSPLRKKHLTTLRSSVHERTEQSKEPGAEGGIRAIEAATLSSFPLRQEPLWLPAGLLAALLVLVSALGAVGGEVYDSGWKSTQASRHQGAAYKSDRSTLDYRMRQPRVAPHPLIPPTKNRTRIRLVAFDAPRQDGPELRVAQNGRARLRSVVIENNGQRRGYRVAQDAVDDQLLEGFQKSFDGQEELPPKKDEDPGFGLPGAGETELKPLKPIEIVPDDMGPMDPGVMPDPFDEQDPAIMPDSPSDVPVDPGRGGLEDVKPEDLTQPMAPTTSTKNQNGFAKAQQDCAEELAELKARRLTQIDLHIGATGAAGEDYPYECHINDGTPYAQRCWPQVCYMWKASALCHKPLYFENVQLERYGHSWGPCLQPIVSGAHFFTRIPVLPYCMGLKTPNECVYTLGHYRPGNCAPYLIDPIPFTWRAAAFQAGAWTGGVFAVP